MKVSESLDKIQYTLLTGNPEAEVDEVAYDSRKAAKDAVLVCIKGTKTDSHDFIPQVIAAGTRVLVVERGLDELPGPLPEDLTVFRVENGRQALAYLSASRFGYPARKMVCIGVTGTKGKTTTTYMIKEILEKQGKKVGLIGTIATYIAGKKLEDSDRTTPESLKLQQLFRQMADAGCEAVVMEVSSQSLKLNRVAGCDFDIGVFTNFSEDHISPKEHPDMEDYFQSKLKLFSMCKQGFANADDLHASRVPKLVTNCPVQTYGIDNYCDLLAKDITITNSYVDFKVKLGDKNERVKTCIPGRFSVYNSLAAISVAKCLGCDAETIKEALVEVRVPGRSELVNNKKELTIMIDYAHSPESLENILNAVKSYTRGRVISVFGCGGDRDPGKRPIMGEISGRIADYSIITSDNPRTEDPTKIVNQIEEGIKKTKGKYTCIVDRIEAIKHAIEIANKKDIIVLAGKGHEPYQEINKEKFPFDERIIVNQIINGEL